MLTCGFALHRAAVTVAQRSTAPSHHRNFAWCGPWVVGWPGLDPLAGRRRAAPPRSKPRIAHPGVESSHRLGWRRYVARMPSRSLSCQVGTRRGLHSGGHEARSGRRPAPPSGPSSSRRRASRPAQSGPPDARVRRASRPPPAAATRPRTDAWPTMLPAHLERVLAPGARPLRRHHPAVQYVANTAMTCIVSSSDTRLAPSTPTTLVSAIKGEQVRLLAARCRASAWSCSVGWSKISQPAPLAGQSPTPPRGGRCGLGGGREWWGGPGPSKER